MRNLWEEADFMKQGIYFVSSKDAGEREHLLELIEKDGFTIRSRGCTDEDVNNTLDQYGYYIGGGQTPERQEIIDSVFPIVINLDDKKYDLLNSITCAVASIKLHISPQRFYEYYNDKE